jgi:hypothetical protein
VLPALLSSLRTLDAAAVSELAPCLVAAIMACGVTAVGPALNLALPLLCPHCEASATVAAAVYQLASARTEAFRAGVAALTPDRRGQLQEGLKKMQVRARVCVCVRACVRVCMCVP